MNSVNRNVMMVVCVWERERERGRERFWLISLTQRCDIQCLAAFKGGLIQTRFSSWGHLPYPFQRNQKWWVSSCSTRVSFLTAASGSCHLPDSQCLFLLRGLYFLPQARSSKCTVSQFVNSFLTNTCFYVHFTHSSGKFSWFALFSHQKFDNWTLFKSGTHFFLFPVILNCLKINIL